MSTLLKPHSPEWFAELEKVNQKQAAITRQLIQLAGRDDVCSICGDEESSDYKVAAEQTLPGMIDTLRLCADCVKIRRMGGEIFYPMTN